MNKQFFSRFMILVLVIVFMVAGCGKTEPTAAPTEVIPATEAPAESDALKVAMILSGPINDDDWNSVGYNGLKSL